MFLAETCQADERLFQKRVVFTKLYIYIVETTSHVGHVISL